MRQDALASHPLCIMAGSEADCSESIVGVKMIKAYLANDTGALGLEATQR